MEFEFTYELISADIDTGTFEIKYIPIEPHLSMVSYNLNIILSDVEGATFDDHLENTVNIQSPQTFWKNQKFIFDNAEAIQQKIT